VVGNLDLIDASVPFARCFSLLYEFLDLVIDPNRALDSLVKIEFSLCFLYKVFPKQLTIP
jgi:hypothetical protein